MEDAFEQVIQLLQVLFPLGYQTFHFAQQMGYPDLVFQGRERDFVGPKRLHVHTRHFRAGNL